LLEDKQIVVVMIIANLMLSFGVKLAQKNSYHLRRRYKLIQQLLSIGEI
jgi:hypothetical protein